MNDPEEYDEELEQILTDDIIDGITGG